MKTIVIVALLAAAGYYVYSTRTPAPPPAAAQDADRHPSDTTPGANAAARMDNLTGQAPP